MKERQEERLSLLPYDWGTDGAARGEPNVFGLSRVVTSGDDVKRFGDGVEIHPYGTRALLAHSEGLEKEG